jgi:hypothetical protein
MTRYGTVEFYSDMFSDILADVDPETENSVDNIIQGFYKSIDSWIEYHHKQSEEFNRMKAKVKAALDD